MTKSVTKNILLVSVALVALSACASEKGPGAIGTKNDIVVRNKGIPGYQEPQTADAAAPAQQGDFTTATEQGEAAPAPAVESAEALPEQSPAVDAAAQQATEAQAPIPATTNAPMSEAPNASPAASAVATQADPVDQTLPVEPVPQTATTNVPPPETIPSSAPQPVQQRTSSVYPAGDYPQQPAAPAPVPTDVSVPLQRAEQPAASASAAPVMTEAAPAVETPAVTYVYAPAPSGYVPANPNAPYSPKDAAAYAASKGAAATASPDVPGAPLNLSDKVVIRSAQAALKAKGSYSGVEDGTINAEFLNALSLYQGQNKLPQGGLNNDTLRSLGVIE
ncbi:MAG: hypothetical protein DI626_00125 [Micavibrio aeruginosavorus]|uniref:Peptidoglycan binding-like domain-containing protein n=1 Tax=Micavibrio aeruginosavorus TaxID=349221 RepID=A0A2W5C1B8_9BACT|nr:MAG: hypothetical protein DI626_00125 [Micavibrio aeruginosavorus]